MVEVVTATSGKMKELKNQMILKINVVHVKASKDEDSRNLHGVPWSLWLITSLCVHRIKSKEMDE